METPLRARFSAIFENSILKYCGIQTSFLMLLVLLSSFTGPVIKNKLFANNTLDKLGLTSSTPAAGAYSLRLLSSPYGDPLVRIAIGSSFYDVYPDAATDRGFSLTSPVSGPYANFNDAVAGNPATTLGAIIGSNSATVAIWFDQSGNGRNGIQGNLSQQPQIINAGTINTSRGKPTIKFTGSQYLVVSTTAFNNDLSGSIVYAATSANTSVGGGTTWYNMNGIVGSEQGGNVADFAYGVYNGRFTAGFGGSDFSVGTTITVNDGTARISTWTRASSSGSVSLFNNGNPNVTTNLPAGIRSSVPSVAIGAATTSGQTFFNGTISEITLFPVVYNATERQAIEASQSTYYSISVTLPLPTVNYGTAQTFATNTAITPVTPTASDVAAPAYKVGEVFTTAASYPSYFRMDSQGNIYFLDADHTNVKKVDINGNISVYSSGYMFPANIAMDANDNLYVIDPDANKIVKTYASDGHTENIVTGVNGLIAANKAGDLYYTFYDGANTRLSRKFASDGHTETLSITFSNPVSMVTDANDNLYVLDNYNGSITKIKPDNTSSVVVSVPGQSIVMVAVDGAGDIYWTNQTNVIHKKNVSSNTYQDITLPNNAIYGLAIRKDGKVFYGDYSGKRIYQVVPSGGYYLDKILPSGLVFDSATGTISGTPTTATTAKDYTITAYGAGGASTSTINITVLSGATDLSALTVTGATVTPAFDAGTIAYSGSVAPSVASIDITPTLASAGSTITYNGSPITSGSAVTVPLSGGTNSMAFVVTAPGGATKTYTVTIIKRVPPTISYAPKIFAINTTVTPLMPTSANVAAFGYGSGVNFGSTFLQIGSVKRDKQGNSYMLDLGNYKIFKYAANSNTGVEIGTDGAYPSAITVDDAGNLYLADAGYGVIKKIAAGTSTVTTISSGISYVYNMTMAKDGTIYLADGGSGSIKKLPAGAGTAVEIDIAFSNATDVVVDADGNLFVADQSNGAIKKIWFSTDSHVETVYSGSQIISLAFDNAGNLFAGDSQYSRILEIPADGSSVQTVASGTAYQYPGGLFVDEKGSVYVATYTANAKMVTPTGGYFIGSNLPKGLSFNQNTGSISGTPTVLSPATPYSITAYGGVESVTSTATIGVASNNADLSTLAVTGATISPVFNAGTISYTASVPSSLASVNITPTLADASATISYNGAPAASGSAVTVPLADGVNTITFIVTAPAGATKTYTVTITKVVPPTVSYGTAQTFVVNTTITPVTPTTTDVNAFGYSTNYTSVGNGEISQAYKIKLDAQGNVYLLDNSYPSKLFKYPADGSPAIEIATDNISTKAMAFDEAGNLYLADQSTHSVKKIAVGTGDVTVLSSAGVNYPFGMAIAKNGTVYIADFGDSNIKQIPAGGGTPVVVGTGFNQPTDVAVDAAGNVYVADQGNGKLKKIWITTDGHTEDITDIRQPVGVTVDKADNVFVSDVSNFRIYELPANGSGPQIIASGSAMQNIYGLDADSKGILYAAQLSNNNGTVITPSGGYFINTKLPAGLSFDQNTGVISGTPTALSAAKNYIVMAYGVGGATSSTIRIAVASNNADLSTLVVSGASLSPVFAANTITYTSSVPSTVTSVTITPTVAATDATITYNDNPVTSGSVVTVPLVGGANTVAFIVTAGTGDTKTYTITINKLIPPTLSYGGAQSLVINTSITPITPTAANVGALGYNNPVTNFGSNLGGQAVRAVFDTNGNAYILSNFRGNVEVVPADGSPVYTIGGPFNFPLALAIDKDNNLYVSDYAGATSPIYKIAAGTTTSTLLTSAYQYILGITPDNQGNLYLADVYGHSVSKYNIGTNTGVSISNAFTYPCTVVLRDDKLFVQDLQTTQIFRMGLDGSNLTQIIAYSGSSSFDIDATGFIYSGNSNLIRWNLDGSNPLTIPTGINDIYTTSADTKGKVYIGKIGGNEMKVLQPSGGYFTDKLLPAGLTFNANTGTISGTPTKLSPATQYRVTAYNGLDSTSSRITLGVEANRNLTNLLTDAGALTPVFNADSISYKISVANGTTSANITATLSEASNSLTINGVAATSGAPASIALNVGDNNIPVVITSPLDGSTKTYTVKIHRISNDYKLHSLTVSTGSLDQSFNADVSDYIVDLPYGTSSAKLTPTANALATIKVADVVTASGIESQTLSLNTGDNNIEVRVTAEDGTSATIYTVNFRVAAPSSVSLSNITLSAGILNPAFDAGKTNYQVSVPIGTSTITVQPVLADALSVVTVNGSALDGTTHSVNVPLNNGLNVITVSVLANDGTTTKSYTITVNKLIPAPTNAPIAAQVYSTGAAITPLSTGFANVAAPGYFAIADTLSKAIPTPTGIAINKAGDLFVADVTAGAIYKLPVGGGAPVAILTGLNTPLGVAVDADGNVYAAALGNTNIKKITPGGTITSIGSGLSFPTGLTVDAAGNIFVDETANHAVKKITPAGVTTTLTTALSFPYGITVDASYIYVADNSTGTIVRFNKSGGDRTDLISGVTNPTDVKLDAAGNIYVNQSGANIITKYDQNGQNPLDISTGYEGLFGIAVGKDGKLYTTDNGKHTIEKLTPSGGYYIDQPLPAGLTFDNATGVISGTPTTITAAKDYTITAYNSGGGTSSVVNISVLVNASLANLTIGSGTLAPLFDGTVTSYTASVPYATGTLTITPTLSDANASITVDGSTTASGVASAAITLNTGVTNIPVIVTARDNATTKQYTIAVTRATAATDATLANLSLTNTSINPPFNAAIFNYAGTVTAGTTTTQVEAIANDPHAHIKFNGDDGIGGNLSGIILLDYGVNIINVLVTAEDLSTQQYTITVTRSLPASSNALANIQVNPQSTLVATTGTGDANYSVSVNAGQSSIVLNTTVYDGATIKINGVSVASGEDSAPIMLNSVGATLITAVVTAQDGTTVKTYTVSVTRAAANNVSANIVLTPASKLVSTGPGNNFTTSVNIGQSSVRVTVTTYGGTAKVNGVSVASGVASDPISLNVGSTLLTVVITSQDGTKTKTYNINVNRNGSSNLSSSITLTPTSALTATAVGTGDANYTTSVGAGQSSVRLTTFVYDNATIKVNGVSVASGAASDPIALNMGSTLITVVVTAENGTITKTTTITVNRTGSSNVAASFALTPASVLTAVAGTGNANYTTTVDAALTSLKVATIVYEGATITVNGVNVASGVASAPILLNTGSTPITVVVTAQDGITTKTYTITVNRLKSKSTAVNLSLNPVSTLTATGDGSYTASVGVTQTSVTLTALSQNNATVKINGVSVANGVASSPILLNAGTTLITAVVTAENGINTKTYTITVSHTGSSNVSANLALSPVSALTASTGPGDVNYISSVSLAQSSVALTTTLYDGATAKLNGVPITSGVASAPIALNAGSTLITVVVTAQNNINTKTYTILITRDGSSNVSANLSLSPVSTLTPTTGTGNVNYATTVSAGQTSVRLTPIVYDGAIVKVNGVTVASGAASDPIVLNATGTTLITTVVTAQNGTTTKTYTVNISRTGSSNASAHLVLNPATTLTTTTGPGAVNYAATVSEGQSSIKVIPTVYDNATVTVNSIAVTGGTASDPVTLAAGGSTLITVVVLAENGSTTKTYTINVTRPTSTLLVNKNDSKLLFANKTANNVTPTGDDGVVVHQGVSPNGDGSNDFLYIEGIDAYAGNKLSIMNTSGSLVFETKDYGKDGSNLFNGHSNKTGALLKPGTYYYALDYQVEKQSKRKTGYIIIKY